MWENLPNCKLGQGDCLELMPGIPDGSVDMVLCDLPYGTIACAWDSIIDIEKLWQHYERLISAVGAIVLTANQPFTSKLIMSRPNLFKYEWVWVKNRPTGAQHSKNRPMGKHESVLVFSKAPMGHKSQLGDRRMAYFPQGAVPTGRKKTVKEKGTHGKHIGARPNQVGIEYEPMTGFPSTILEFDKEETHLHPTQKPLGLMEYLVKTYTTETHVVLDNCFGSGTTGVACVNLNRRFIGIEKDATYFALAKERIQKAIDAKTTEVPKE